MAKIASESLITIRGDRQFSLCGNLATMAPGPPYAVGIQHAFPGRQVPAAGRAEGSRSHPGAGGRVQLPDPDRAGRDRAHPRAPGPGTGQGRHPRGRPPWPAGLSLTPA